MSFADFMQKYSDNSPSTGQLLVNNSNNNMPMVDSSGNPMLFPPSPQASSSNASLQSNTGGRFSQFMQKYINNGSQNQTPQQTSQQSTTQQPSLLDKIIKNTQTAPTVQQMTADQWRNLPLSDKILGTKALSSDEYNKLNWFEKGFVLNQTPEQTQQDNTQRQQQFNQQQQDFNNFDQSLYNFDKNHPVFHSALGGVANTMSLGAIKALTNQIEKKTSEPTLLTQAEQNHPLAYQVGSVAGFLAPGALAEKGLKVLAPGLSSIARNAIIGGGLMGTQSAVEGQSPQDIALNTLFGTVGGGVGGKVFNALDKTPIPSNLLGNIAKGSISGGAGFGAGTLSRDIGSNTIGQTNLTPQQIALDTLKNTGAGTLFGGVFSGIGGLGESKLPINGEMPTTEQSTPIQDLVKATTGKYTKVEQQPQLLTKEQINSIENLNGRLTNDDVIPNYGFKVSTTDDGIAQIKLNNNTFKFSILPDGTIKNGLLGDNATKIDYMSAREQPQLPVANPQIKEDLINRLQQDYQNSQTQSPTQSGYEHIDGTPLNITPDSNGYDIRSQYVSNLNNKVLKGLFTTDDIAKLAPNEQEGITAYNEFGGNKDWMQKTLSNKNPALDQPIPDNPNMTFRQAIEQALVLSPEAQKASGIFNKANAEIGDYSKKTGSIDNVIDNWNNRIYQKETTGKPQTEIYNKGINPFTSHAKERVYKDDKNIFDAVIDGHTPATLNASKLFSIANEEMAKANVNRMLIEGLKSQGGRYFTPGQMPEDYKKIESLGKNVPVVDKNGNALIARYEYGIPKALGKDLAAITDADKLQNIPGYKALQKLQGIVKTTKLGLSFFHDKNLGLNTLMNGDASGEFLKNLPQMDKYMQSDEYREKALNFVKNNGTLSKLATNQDIMRNLTAKDESNIIQSILSKGANLPGIKQGIELSEAHAKFLFNKYADYAKVEAWNSKYNDWLNSHPDATEAEKTDAGRSLGRQVNANYGGLNWKVLGYSPTVQGVLRTLMLAPDWTISKAVEQPLLALSKGAGGDSARAFYARSLVVGAIMTEVANYAMSGHLTDKNEQGHETEVEIAPGVHATLLPAEVTDAMKLGSYVDKYAKNNASNATTPTSEVVQGGIGALMGGVKFAENKASPIVSAGLNLNNLLQAEQAASATTAKGFKAYDNKQVTNAENNLAEGALPIPINAVSTYKDIQSGNATLAGIAALASGIGTYTNPPKLPVKK